MTRHRVLACGSADQEKTSSRRHSAHKMTLYRMPAFIWPCPIFFFQISLFIVELLSRVCTLVIKELYRVGSCISFTKTQNGNVRIPCFSAPSVHTILTQNSSSKYVETF